MERDNLATIHWQKSANGSIRKVGLLEKERENRNNGVPRNLGCSPSSQGGQCFQQLDAYSALMFGLD